MTGFAKLACSEPHAIILQVFLVVNSKFLQEIKLALMYPNFQVVQDSWMLRDRYPRCLLEFTHAG